MLARHATAFGMYLVSTTIIAITLMLYQLDAISFVVYDTVYLSD